MARKKQPKVVEKHITQVISSTDWEHIASIIGQPCAGCPAKSQPDDDTAPACYSCPLWGFLLDLAQLRLLRRLEDGNKSGLSDRA